MLVNRSIYFKNGVAVGIAPQIVDHDHLEVIALPTDHYDFAGLNVLGMTVAQIQQAVILHQEGQS